jgi:hypothetical protein
MKRRVWRVGSFSLLDVAKNTSILDFAENWESPTIGFGNPSPSSDLIG